MSEKYGVIYIHKDCMDLTIGQDGETVLTAGEYTRPGVLTDQLQAVGTLLLLLDNHGVKDYEII